MKLTRIPFFARNFYRRRFRGELSITLKELLVSAANFTGPKTKQISKTNLYNAADHGAQLPNGGTTLDSLLNWWPIWRAIPAWRRRESLL